LKLRPEEITSILKQRIEDFDVETNLSEVGTVLQVGDGIARLYGLENAVALEMLELEHGVVGLAFNLEEDNVGAALFGEWEHVREGEPVRRTGRVASVPVGDALLGRVVDPLGRPLDGQGPIQTEETRQLEFKAPGVVDRQPVKEPLQTGLKAIDSMIPIGRGQRELILGDRSTGKTAILVDTILNQRDTDVVCIYVAIGQKASTVAQVYERLRDAGAMEYTIIVTAAANEAAPIKWMAPYAGCAMGEHVMFNGGHSLLMYDDLSKHADAYRQMSLLLRRPPGREAFPGDVFYLHSRLLERACKLNDEFGAGSLTALPVIETQAGDVAAYIPTNVISITDGQIYLETDLFFSGIRPAIDVGRSVSRVGGNAQVRAMRKVAGRLRLDLSQYRELEAFAQFGSELDATTQAALGRGERMVATLNQPQYDPWPTEEQVVALYAGINGYLDDIPAEDVPRFQDELREYMKTDKTILGEIRESGDISDDLEKQLREAIERFKETFAVTEQETVAA
jgi:F-type H+/Na+-transporting ATPase subunit alpha